MGASKANAYHRPGNPRPRKMRQRKLLGYRGHAIAACALPSERFNTRARLHPVLVPVNLAEICFTAPIKIPLRTESETRPPVAMTHHLFQRRTPSQRRCFIVERTRSRNLPFGSRSPRSHFARVLGSNPSSRANAFCVSPRVFRYATSCSAIVVPVGRGL